MRTLLKGLNALAANYVLTPLHLGIEELDPSWQADQLLEWQQPLLQALDRNQSELSSQLAGVSVASRAT